MIGKAFFGALALFFTLAVSAVAQTGPAVETPRVTATLVAERAEIAPGETFWVALRLEIIDGWHTYWRNPGDSGQPVMMNWSLPDGWSAADIAWPIPEKIPFGPLVNYGFHGAPMFLVQMKAPDDTPLGETTLRADGTWLVCADVCIPEDGRVTLPITVSEAGSDAPLEVQALFRAARAMLPTELVSEARFAVSPDNIQLGVESSGFASALRQNANIEFFPYEEGVIEYAKPQTVAIGEEGFVLTLAPGFKAKDLSDRLDGVIVWEDLSGEELLRRGFEVSAQAGPVPASWSSGGAATAAAASGGLLAAIVGAFIGGLILNLMPCVFPVLFVKALGFANHAASAPGLVKRHGVVFTIGVLASFLVLAGALLALRAGGAELGWGFQLQSPLLVTALAYVFFLIGLNLSGVFEIGGGAAGVGQSLADKKGDAGAFFTGVLAVIVATPCTAPFMAAALGFALTQPPVFSLAVFLSLGLGLAAPYLALSFAPGLAARLPKPGPWMERLRQAFAFPMYGSAVWLVWVLSRQAGPDQAALVLFGMVALGFGVWALAGGKTLGRVTGVLGLIAAAVLAFQTLGAPPAATRAVLGGAGGGYGDIETETFSPQRLAELRDEGTPVFIDFTAAWCITCQANKLTALSQPGVADAFAAKGVKLLVADWTNRDPVIAEILQSYGRAGVPLYLLFGQGGEPQILPSLLTEGIVIEAVSNL